jgi:hypothetical protein
MVDFYPVLKRAISNLPDNSAQMRNAVYTRAREVMIGQLRNVDPPMSETDIARARLSLDETIDRLEREQLAHVAEVVPASATVTASRPTSAPETPHDLRKTDDPPVVDDPTPAALVPAALAPAALDSVVLEPVLHQPAQQQPATQEPAAPGRPRLQQRGKRPIDQAGRKRTFIVAGGVVAAVIAIASAGFYVNRGEPQVVPTRGLGQDPTVAVQPKPGDGKINERIGTEAAPNRPAGAIATAPQAGGTRPTIAVAQRAVLYIENTASAEQPIIGTGRVSWRLDTEVAGQGQPVETVVRADLDFPDQGLKLTFTVRRNLDPAFPASHIIGLRFARSSDDGNGAVKEAGVPQFKTEETERGAPLSAITSALGDNLFVAALSRVQVEQERNVELITKRNWIDVPVRFNSGKRGIIAFEKGFSGDQTLNDAFNRWR